MFIQYKKEYEGRPSDLTLLERLGHLAMMLNKKEEAAEFYSKILEKDLTNTLCYEQLMDIYIDTDKYKYYVYRGNLHSVDHKLEQAISDYKKALNHTDDEKEIVMTRFTLANLYQQTGNTSKAIDEFMKISGVGEKKAARYGKKFMQVIADYKKEDAVNNVNFTAGFSFPNSGENQRGYIAYTISNVDDKYEDVMISEWLNYVHQRAVFMHPFKSAYEHEKNYNMFSSNWNFRRTQDALQFDNGEY